MLPKSWILVNILWFSAYVGLLRGYVPLSVTQRQYFNADLYKYLVDTKIALIILYVPIIEI